MIPSTTRAVAVLTMALTLFGGISNLFAVGEDTDGDGIPDDWELAFGLNPNNPNDAALDPDADGMTNLEEYRADTHPQNASSLLRMTSIAVDISDATLGFSTRPGLLYTLEFRNSLVGTNWAAVDQLVAVGTSANIIDSTTGQTSNRSYRVSAARSSTNAAAYSVNRLGFAKQNVPVGSNSITRPLLLTANDLITTLFPTAPPDTVVYKFIPATQTYESSVYVAGLGWYDESFIPSQMELLPGEAFLLSAPSAFSISFTGELLAQPIGGNNSITWTNLAGGNWSDPANWNPNQVPTATNDVQITVPGTYTVTLDVHAHVAAFTLGASIGKQTFNNTGHLFTADLSFINANGVAILSEFNGTGTWSGTNNVSGRFLWRGGIVNGLLAIAPTGALEITNSVHTLAGTLLNQGTTQFRGTLSCSGASVINNSGFWLFLGSNNVLQKVSPLGTASFSNSGTLRQLATVTTTFNLPLVNTGSVELLAGTLIINVPATGGTWNVSGGASLSFAAGGVLNGNYSIATGALGQLGGGDFTYSAESNFTGSGAFLLNSGSLTLLNNQPAQIIIDGGTVRLSPQFQGGTITNFTLRAGTLAGTNRVTGTFTWLSGVLDGRLSVAPGGTLEITNGNHILIGNSSALINEGTVHHRTGDLSCQNRSVITNAGLWLYDGVTASIQNGFESAFHNLGTLRKTTALTVTFSNLPIFNSGSVEVLAGVLDISPASLTQSDGTLLVNGQLNSVGTTFVLTGGSLSGTGSINANVLNGGRVAPGPGVGVLTISGNYTQTVSGSLEIEISGAGAVTADRLDILGTAALAGPLQVRVINPTPAPTVYPALVAAQLNGQFTIVSTVPGNFDAEAVYQGNSVLINLTAGAPTQPASIVVPPANLTVLPGVPATFSVVATGTPPISYQWRYNGATLPAETNPTLVIPNAHPTNSGMYSVVVRNDFGPAVTSDPARLLVQASNLFFADHFADRPNNTALSGIGSGSNVGATREPGEPLHVNKTGGHSVWFGWTAPVSGIATFQTRGTSFDTLVGVYVGPDVAHLTTIASDEDSGGFFSSFIRFNAVAGTSYAIAIDGLGGAEGDIVLSWSVDAAATSSVPVIVTQPVNRISPPGGTVTFGAAVANAASYQWFFNGILISGATNSQLTITNIDIANIGVYTVRITNADQAVMSDPVVLDLGPTTVTPTVDKFEDLFSSNSIPINNLAASRKPKPSQAASVAAGSILSSSYGATSQACEPNHGGVPGGASRWQLFRFEVDGVLSINTATSTVPTSVAAYTGSFLCGLTPVAEDAPGPTNNFAAIQFRARAGVSYPVAIDPVGGEVGLMALNWRFDPAPTLVTPFDRIQVIPGTNLFLSINVTGGPADLGYQWARGTNGADIVSGATNAFLFLTNLQPNSLGVYRLLVTYLGVVIAERDIDLVLESTRPVIIVEPLDVNGGLGGSGTFSVQVAGEAPFSYQWQRQPVAKKNSRKPLPPFASVPGATGASYTTPPLTKTSAGSFRVIVTNSFGSTTSRTVRLQTFRPVIITKQPADVARPAGDQVVLSSKAKGDALSYQWYLGDSPLPGVIGPKLTIPALDGASAGQYYVIVSNPAGSATSRVATVSIAATIAQKSRANAISGGAGRISLQVAKRGDLVRLAIAAPPGRYEVLVSPDLKTWQRAGVVNVESGPTVFEHRSNTTAAFYQLHQINP